MDYKQKARRMANKRKEARMSNDFMLVEWINDEVKSYSVAKVGSITDGELRCLGTSLVGRIVEVTWGKAVHSAKVIDVGSRNFMTILCDELAEKETENDDVTALTSPILPDSPAPAKRPKNQQIAKNTAQSISHVLGLVREDVVTINENIIIGERLDNETFEVNVEPLDLEPTEAEVTEYDALKTKYKRLKERFRALKAKYRVLKGNTHNPETTVELFPDSGVILQKEKLESVKVMSKEKTIFARNLFRLLFTAEELNSHSLYGKKCNANKSSIPLPEIDVIRRDAIINYVLKEYGVESVPTSKDSKKILKQAKKDINKSLSDFLREECRKSKPHETPH